MLAKYDNGSPAALRHLLASGVKVLPFPTPVLEACFGAANEVFAETKAKSPNFKKIFDTWSEFRREGVLWSRVAEGGFDTFMARQSAANKL